ncbi:hypothetical protein [Planococcus lenghuensis]|uniref:Uncharacterized protein n=1 Tax=Planococcus lenghuensis TaxID=2213202 RepID=A0A1Q2L4P7_9BACL|nr:hypothetical protein [Planococcus lenghuensis]AQQ55396.1 hypothetical protein B0X71_19705 [Planococcus lenghuensis]
MTTATVDRIRLTKDLEDSLVYFAHRQSKSLSREEAADISRRVMANVDINNSAFAHKGPSWIAREIINNRK